MNKKASELSINVIIIAVIALVVLAVLIFIFSGKASMFSRSVSQTCKAQGGVCQGQPCPADKPVLIYARCEESDKEAGPCCIPTPTG